MTPVVPVGHYLGQVHDDGTVRHRVRLGSVSEPLESGVEAAVWFAAHSFTNVPDPTMWNRERILELQPSPERAAAAFDALLAHGLLAEVGPAFADRYRLMPLTIGRGWQDDGGRDDVFALGTGERTVLVDETVLRVWECGAEHPTLRAACAAAAPRDVEGTLAAVVAALHRLLAVSAIYVETAGSATSR